MYQLLRLLLLGVVLQACIGSSAHAGFRIGATGGGTFGKFADDPLGYVSNGLSGGVSVGWSRGWFSAQTDVLYARRGGAFSPAIISNRAEYDLKTVVVPLSVSYTLGPTWAIQVRAIGGVELAYLLESHTSFVDFSGRVFNRERTQFEESWDIAPMVGLGLAVSPLFEVAVRHSWSKDEDGFGLRTLWILATLWFPL